MAPLRAGVRQPAGPALVYGPGRASRAGGHRAGHKGGGGAEAKRGWGREGRARRRDTARQGVKNDGGQSKTGVQLWRGLAQGGRCYWGGACGVAAVQGMAAGQRKLRCNC